MDINKIDYYGWFNGEEGDDMKYLWFSDKETRNLFIVPKTEEEMTTFNQEYKEIRGENAVFDPNRILGKFSIVAGVAIICSAAHVIMSETEGYQKIGNWSKDKINNIKSKFHKKS